MYPQVIFKENNINAIYKIELKQIDIFNKLWNISYETATDPDEISPIFLKKCAFLLTPAISSLINKSLLSVIFPKRRKASFLTPIKKNVHIFS